MADTQKTNSIVKEKTDPFSLVNPREAALLALITASRGQGFLSDFFPRWRHHSSPSDADFHLAQEIAYGAMRMSLALDHLAKQLADKKSLSLKPLEKALVRIAIYQFFYMDRIPLYAIADESVALARKHCHPTFARFLNAILRKISQTPLSLPEGNTVESLSIRYSYPVLFIQSLLESYGLDTTLEILEAGNQPAPVMYRVRNPEKFLDAKWVCQDPCRMAILEDSTQLESIVASRDAYIQNATPATLIGHRCQKLPFEPKTLLDLCAAPGGKSLCFHDFYPRTELFMNDLTEDKISLLKQNFTKYDIPAHFSCSAGENLQHPHPFDIVILDVPCSNSGVLNKRPEARWRLTPDHLAQLERMQEQLLRNAASLLSPKGQIWYMTCSILPSENEGIIFKALNHGLIPLDSSEAFLPNRQGWDGGFCLALGKN